MFFVKTLILLLPLLLWIDILYPQRDTSITLSEIMFIPFTENSEFIEVFNLSETESFDLNNYKIRYSASNADIINSAGSGTIIKPRTFAVIVEGDYDLVAGMYNSIIPPGTLVLKIADNAFGSSGMSNSSDRLILLLNSEDDIIDNYIYSADNNTGISDEKIFLNKDSSKENWGNSNLHFGTPGRINSITTKNYDLSAAEILFSPEFPVKGEIISVSVKIKNKGIFNADNFIVEFYSNTGSTADKLLSTSENLNLAAGDSLIITSGSSINFLSKITAAVKIIFKNDEDTLNNYTEKSFEPGPARYSCLINEFMYDPQNGEPEWIELINISGDTLNLRNWSISDLLPSAIINSITNKDLLIPPDSFIILARDTSFFRFHDLISAPVRIVYFGSLGNTEDGIILYDFRNGVIDSVRYKSSWGGRNGYSLERTSTEPGISNNSFWATSLSLSGNTAGTSNSLMNIPDISRNTLVVNEIMFDPDIDNGEFIEFINLYSDSINIGGWKIEDENGNSYKLYESSFYIQPGGYFLLTSDSLVFEKYNLHEYSFKRCLNISSLGLVNSGELILLKNVKGNIIDSVFYSDKWHNSNFGITKNRSLERLNPHLNPNDQFNWSSSADPEGATPGKRNSIYTGIQKNNSQISVSPNPFSPDNDGFEDFTIINYTLKQSTSQIRIKIFDSRGRLVRTLLSNHPSGSSGSVIFDGLDDDGRALRIGIYIAFLEALNDNTGVVEALKIVFVIARNI